MTDYAALFAQVSAVSNNVLANLGGVLSNLNLSPYVAPVASAVQKVASPYVNHAIESALPLVLPYVEPYLGDGKAALLKVTEAETYLIIVGLFGGTLLLQLLMTLTALFNRHASKLAAFSPTVFWLTFCGVMHIWVEYNFVFNRSNGKSGYQAGMDLYAASDFRYAVDGKGELEPGTRSMEAITALVTGPLALLAAWGLVHQRSWRYAALLAVCTCQLYGLCWFAGHTLFEPAPMTAADPFLYWVLFVGFNAPWGIIPPVLALVALRGIVKATAVADRVQRAAKETAKVHAINKKNN